VLELKKPIALLPGPSTAPRGRSTVAHCRSAHMNMVHVGALVLHCCVASAVRMGLPGPPGLGAARSAGPRLAGPGAAELEDLPTLRVDWSFLDAAFLITVPNVDGSNPRLPRAMSVLEQVGLSDLVEVREFERDDEDRVRGCYTSHVAVLEEAQQRFSGRTKLNVLVLEDNIAVSPRIEQETLNAVEAFCGADGAAERRDMVHLAYIMYVPGLSVEASPSNERIVRLRCSPDSVLGTTAYIVTRSGLDGILAEHAVAGYVDAIPNVCARLFADSRYAAFPMPFHRAASVKSLVNGQLDSLRSILFLPQVFTVWERLLVGSRLNTNLLFPALCLGLLLGAIGGITELIDALGANARGESVPLLMPLLSAAVALSCLAVLGYGLALAPKPQPAAADTSKP